MPEDISNKELLRIAETELSTGIEELIKPKDGKLESLSPVIINVIRSMKETL